MTWKQNVDAAVKFCFFKIIYWFLPYISFRRFSSYAHESIRSLFSSNEDSKQKRKNIIKSYESVEGREFAKKATVTDYGNLSFLLNELPPDTLSKREREKLTNLLSICFLYIKIETAVNVFCACLFVSMNYYYYHYIMLPRLS